jgi:hypothetical protein
LNLKHAASIPKRRKVTQQDRDVFKTIEFDPNELLELRDMEYKELLLLMLFCGVRVFNEIPLIAMTEDEMRMAYILWRAHKIGEKKEDMKVRVERGIRWIEKIQKTVEFITISMTLNR